MEVEVHTVDGIAARKGANSPAELQVSVLSHQASRPGTRTRVGNNWARDCSEFIQPFATARLAR